MPWNRNPREGEAATVNGEPWVIVEAAKATAYWKKYSYAWTVPDTRLPPHPDTGGCSRSLVQSSPKLLIIVPSHLSGLDSDLGEYCP